MKEIPPQTEWSKSSLGLTFSNSIGLLKRFSALPEVVLIGKSVRLHASCKNEKTPVQY